MSTWRKYKPTRRSTNYRLQQYSETVYFDDYRRSLMPPSPPPLQNFQHHQQPMNDQLALNTQEVPCQPIYRQQLQPHEGSQIQQHAYSTQQQSFQHPASQIQHFPQPSQIGYLPQSTTQQVPYQQNQSQEQHQADYPATRHQSHGELPFNQYAPPMQSSFHQQPASQQQPYNSQQPQELQLQLATEHERYQFQASNQHAYQQEMPFGQQTSYSHHPPSQQQQLQFQPQMRHVDEHPNQDVSPRDTNDDFSEVSDGVPYHLYADPDWRDTWYLPPSKEELQEYQELNERARKRQEVLEQPQGSQAHEVAKASTRSCFSEPASQQQPYISQQPQELQLQSETEQERYQFQASNQHAYQQEMPFDQQSSYSHHLPSQQQQMQFQQQMRHENEHPNQKLQEYHEMSQKPQEVVEQPQGSQAHEVAKASTRSCSSQTDMLVQNREGTQVAVGVQTDEPLMPVLEMTTVTSVHAEPMGQLCKALDESLSPSVHVAELSAKEEKTLQRDSDRKQPPLEEQRSTNEVSQEPEHDTQSLSENESENPEQVDEHRNKLVACNEKRVETMSALLNLRATDRRMGLTAEQWKEYVAQRKNCEDPDLFMLVQCIREIRDQEAEEEIAKNKDGYRRWKAREEANGARKQPIAMDPLYMDVAPEDAHSFMEDLLCVPEEEEKPNEASSTKIIQDVISLRDDTQIGKAHPSTPVPNRKTSNWHPRPFKSNTTSTSAIVPRATYSDRVGSQPRRIPVEVQKLGSKISMITYASEPTSSGTAPKASGCSSKKDELVPNKSLQVERGAAPKLESASEETAHRPRPNPPRPLDTDADGFTKPRRTCAPSKAGTESFLIKPTEASKVEATSVEKPSAPVKSRESDQTERKPKQRNSQPQKQTHLQQQLEKEAKEREDSEVLNKAQNEQSFDQYRKRIYRDALQKFITDHNKLRESMSTSTPSASNIPWISREVLLYWNNQPKPKNMKRAAEKFLELRRNYWKDVEHGVLMTCLYEVLMEQDCDVVDEYAIEMKDVMSAYADSADYLELAHMLSIFGLKIDMVPDLELSSTSPDPLPSYMKRSVKTRYLGEHLSSKPSKLELSIMLEYKERPLTGLSLVHAQQILLAEAEAYEGALVPTHATTSLAALFRHLASVPSPILSFDIYFMTEAAKADYGLPVQEYKNYLYREYYNCINDR